MRFLALVLAFGLVMGAGAADVRAASSQAWYFCQEDGRADQAVRACSGIIKNAGETGSNLAYAYLYRGDAYLAQHQNDLAAADFQASLKSAPLAHAWYGLGMVAKAKGDWASAADAFGKAAASRSDDADADHFSSDSLGSFRDRPLTELGYALFKQGQASQALDALTRAAAACPSCAEPPRYQSLVLTEQKRFPEAQAAADRAIALDPRAPGGFFFRGVLRATMGKSDLAIADYTEALRLDPAFEQARQARTRAYARGGKAEKADAPQASGAPMTGTALHGLISGRTWRATSGLWAVDIEFRADGSLRERLSDQTGGGRFKVTSDGAWAVLRGQVCLYTNRRVCMFARQKGANLTLSRNDGTVEFTGAVSALKPLAADNASSPVKEFPLREVLLPAAKLAPPHGRTVLYYIHGFEGRAAGHSQLLEYFLERVRGEQGWDVIDADYPLDVGADGQVMRYEAANYGSAAFVARRIKELKAQGYDRIIVGGQSWGGWTSLVLSTEPNLPLSGTLLIVPACCGWVNTGDAGDPDLQANTLRFNQLIDHVRYPTVGVFFQGDRGETGERGDVADRVLTAHHVPDLIIDHPPGLVGHGAGWFPAFDYEFGDCIAAFLTTPKASRCAPRPIKTADFRTVFDVAQLGAHRKPVAPKDLIGKRYGLWPTGELRSFTSADQTQVTSYALGQTNQASSFRKGAYCWRGRIAYRQAVSTNEQCLDLYVWSDHEILAVDKSTGAVVQWWTLQTP